MIEITESDIAEVRRMARTLPRVGAASATDYTSAALLGLARAAATYDPSKGASFRTYASRCARNEAMHVYVHECRLSRHTVPLDAPILGDDRTLADVIPSLDDVETTVAAECDASMVREVVYDLPPTDRRVLVACAIEGLGQAEIGAEIGLSQSAVSRVKARAIHRAKNNLKKAGIC